MTERVVCYLISRMIYSANDVGLLELYAVCKAE
jgi:hypothetical protein